MDFLKIVCYNNKNKQAEDQGGNYEKDPNYGNFCVYNDALRMLGE